MPVSKKKKVSKPKSKSACKQCVAKTATNVRCKLKASCRISCHDFCWIHAKEWQTKQSCMDWSKKDRKADDFQERVRAVTRERMLALKNKGKIPAPPVPPPVYHPSPVQAPSLTATVSNPSIQGNPSIQSNPTGPTPKVTATVSNPSIQGNPSTGPTPKLPSASISVSNALQPLFAGISPAKTPPIAPLSYNNSGMTPYLPHQTLIAAPQFQPETPSPVPPPSRNHTLYKGAEFTYTEITTNKFADLLFNQKVIDVKTVCNSSWNLDDPATRAIFQKMIDVLKYRDSHVLNDADGFNDISRIIIAHNNVTGKIVGFIIGTKFIPELDWGPRHHLNFTDIDATDDANKQQKLSLLNGSYNADWAITRLFEVAMLCAFKQTEVSDNLLALLEDFAREEGNRAMIAEIAVNIDPNIGATHKDVNKAFKKLKRAYQYTGYTTVTVKHNHNKSYYKKSKKAKAGELSREAILVHIL
jgi:hypothetical protein